MRNATLIHPAPHNSFMPNPIRHPESAPPRHSIA